MTHSKGTAAFFSLLPGAGHMYLGLKKQGIELMLLFFFTIFISSEFHLEFLAIFLPVIWFYSIFDVRDKASSEVLLIDSDLPIFSNLNYNNELTKNGSFQKYIAYFFITIGILSITNNILFPIAEKYIDYMLLRYIRSAIVSLVLLISGFILLLKRKNPPKKAGEEICMEEKLEP